MSEQAVQSAGPAPAALNPVTLTPEDLGRPEAIEAFTGLCLTALADPGTGALIFELGERAPRGGLPAALLAASETLPQTHDALLALINVVRTARVPTVARLSGKVGGPAATLALATALRVAGPSLRFGFPERRLGLLPLGGAMGLAAARAGAGPTLDAVLSGRWLGAAEAEASGLVEIVTATEPPAAGVAARKLIDEGGAHLLADRRGALEDPDRFLGATAAARLRATDPLSETAIDCIEAVLLLPPEVAASIEAEALAQFAAAPGTRARLRRARTEARLARGGPRPAGVALLGAAPELAPIAAAIIAADLPVTFVDPEIDRLRAALEAVAGDQDRAVEAGRLSEAARDHAWGLVSATLEPSGIIGADVALAAGPALDGVDLPPGLVGAALAVDTTATGALPGLWLTLGAGGGGLAEIVAGREVSHDSLRRLAGLAEALGALAVKVAPGRALPSLRLRFVLWRAVADCVALGCAPAALEAAFRDLGLARGPVATALDLGAAGLASLLRAAGTAEAARIGPAALDRLFQSEAAPVETPLGAAEARDLCLAALANEGMRLIAEATLPDAEAVDLVATLVLGLPADLGGPMLWAERLGGRTRLLAARNLLRGMAVRTGAGPGPAAAVFWEPAAGWEERIRAGRGA
ncbi:enoyl-CoA hydratase-related protein [Frigidibacter sp. MR17.14]|uniref:enoyl-CoA hydratase-related protein n=1 Tax=Frigidibacter sp. MR17.14 TaxID=3126509 RepID=UPI003012D815